MTAVSPAARKLLRLLAARSNTRCWLVETNYRNRLAVVSEQSAEPFFGRVGATSPATVVELTRARFVEARLGITARPGDLQHLGEWRGRRPGELRTGTRVALTEAGRLRTLG